MTFLQKKIFGGRPRPAGLDISDLSIKAVWSETENSMDRVKSFGSVSLPIGAVVDGDIIRPEAVKTSLKELYDQAGPKKIHGRQVVCSLPEMKVFLRLIFMPRMGRDEIREAIKWELEGNIPLTLEQIYYDYEELEDEMTFLADDKHKAVLVVAVARHVVDRYVEVIESAGLEVVGLESESIADARVMASSGECPPRTSLIVDMGDRRTSFLIAVGNVPIFASSSHLSSQMVTDVISKSLRITTDEAERLKLQYGIGSSMEGNPLIPVIEGILGDIAGEIERSMDFYVGSLRYTPSIDRVILCGGGANLLGLIPFFVRRLQKPVEIGNPWVNFSFDTALPIIPAEQAVQFSTAIGLSLGGHYSSLYAYQD